MSCHFTDKARRILHTSTYNLVNLLLRLLILLSPAHREYLGQKSGLVSIYCRILSVVPSHIHDALDQIADGNLPADQQPVASTVHRTAMKDTNALTDDVSSSSERRRDRQQLDKKLAVAAEKRRQIKANALYHNPPAMGDIWICEFCEYESIFGAPPRALIRNYELKDRRQKREEAGRRRLLEKAKAKGRKGKKPAKANKTQPAHSMSSLGKAKEKELITEDEFVPSDKYKNVAQSEGGSGLQPTKDCVTSRQLLPSEDNT